MTECELLSAWNRGKRTEASFNYTYSAEEPKTLEISYSEDSIPLDVVDFDLSVDVCPFDGATNGIFERLAEKCEEPHNQIMRWMDDVFGEKFGAKVCRKSKQNGNPAYYCFLDDFITVCKNYSGRIDSCLKQSSATYEYRSTGDFFVPVAFKGQISVPDLGYLYDPSGIDFSKIGNSCDHYLNNGSDEYGKARVVLDTIKKAKDPDWTPP